MVRYFPHADASQHCCEGGELPLHTKNHVRSVPQQTKYDEILHLMISGIFELGNPTTGDVIVSENLAPNYITITKIEQKY